MNKVTLIGRLTKEPEMRKLASGKTVTQFTLATHDYRSGSEKSEFHSIVTCDTTASTRFRAARAHSGLPATVRYHSMFDRSVLEGRDGKGHRGND